VVRCRPLTAEKVVLSWGQSMWGLWWTKWLGTGFPPSTLDAYWSSCSKLLYNRTQGRSLDSFQQKWCHFGNLVASRKEGTLFVFKSLMHSSSKYRNKQRGYCLVWWRCCRLSLLKQEQKGYAQLPENIYLQVDNMYLYHIHAKKQPKRQSAVTSNSW
jgi:hypothetical protein